MFAVVKIAGQQFRVQKDQTLYVPHLEGEIGDNELTVIMIMMQTQFCKDVKTKIQVKSATYKVIRTYLR
jgi:ribosomal protein L21